MRYSRVKLIHMPSVARGGWQIWQCTQSVVNGCMKGFVGELSVKTMEGIVEPNEELSFFVQVNFVKSFCYLGTG